MEKVNPHDVHSTDIIVGIPSYNEADNISFVVEQCNRGLRQYFPDYKSVIINCDNNSPDHTRDAFLNSVNTIPKVYLSTEPGVKGKGNNFFNLFNEARDLNAKAVVVVDADLMSITPEWIRDLASPILNDNHDYITPLYSRNEYDGTITNNICYPLLYGLLRKDIRQPIGGDFAFSGRLGQYYLKQNWYQTTRQYGIDIFMSLHAITGGFKIGQVALGAKIHKPSAPKLGPMFTQVVGTLFNTLLSCKTEWLKKSKIERLQLFGNHELTTPQGLSVDYKSIKARATEEFRQNQQLLLEHLTPSIFNKLAPMFNSGKLNIGADLWTKSVYDLLYAYEKTNLNQNLIEAMKAVYFGRVASFIKQTLDMDYYASENLIRRQAKHFLRSRKYLLSKYN